MRESASSTQKVLHVEETFDRRAFCELRQRLDAATGSGGVLLDRGVRTFDLFALTALCELVAKSEGALRLRGLCKQHEVLLGYLGLFKPVVLPDSPISEVALG